jgi:hypothetical protein
MIGISGSWKWLASFLISSMDQGGLAKHAPAHLRVRHAEGCFEGANALTLGHSVPVQHRLDEGSEGSVPIFFCVFGCHT